MARRKDLHVASSDDSTSPSSGVTVTSSEIASNSQPRTQRTLPPPQTRIIAGFSLVSHRALISPNGKWLLCICESSVRVYSAETGTLQSVLESEVADDQDRASLISICFNPTIPLTQIYTLSSDGEIVLWNYDNAVAVKRWRAGTETVAIFVPFRGSEGFFLLRRVPEPRSAEGVNGGEEGLVKKSCSCTLMHLPHRDALPNKTNQRLLIKNLSEDPKKICFDGRGEYVCGVNENVLSIFFFGKETFKKHLIQSGTGDQVRHFICIAAHPKERCLATGDSQGRILLWRGFDDAKTVVKSVLHWHSSAVLDLAFSSEGSYLWSGGWESTLVQWSLTETSHRDFFPRMGSPIVHLSISFENGMIAVSHQDGVINIVGLQRNILCTIKSLSWSAAVASSLELPLRPLLVQDGNSHSLVIRGKPGFLQFYNPEQDKLILNLDVVEKNIICSGLGDFVNSQVTAVAFSATGSWMATADCLFTSHVGNDVNLKFWRYNLQNQSWSILTKIVDPHDSDEIRSISFNPSKLPTTTSALTIGMHTFKLWLTVEEKTLRGSRTVWCCIGAGDFHGLPPIVGAFSVDGSTLAMAYAPMVTFWDVESVSVRDANIEPQTGSKEIRDVAFCSEKLFILTTKSHVCVWDLSRWALVRKLKMEDANVSTEVHTNVFVVYTDRRVAVFRCNEEKAIFTHQFTFQDQIQACMLVPAPEQNGGTYPSSWADQCRLYYLTSNGRLGTVDQQPKKTLAAQRLAQLAQDPKSVFATLAVSALESSFTSELDAQPVSVDPKRLLSMPVHTLPPVQYFLTAHLNALLGLSDKNEDEIDASQDEDAGEKKADSDDDDRESAQPLPCFITEIPVEPRSDLSNDLSFKYFSNVSNLDEISNMFNSKQQSIEGRYKHASCLYQQLRSDTS